MNFLLILFAYFVTKSCGIVGYYDTVQNMSSKQCVSTGAFKIELPLNILDDHRCDVSYQWHR